MAQRRVLVVDDEPIVGDVLLRYLQRDGFAVDVARDGRVALTTARERPPDLVILDLMLPGLNGLDVCRELRRVSPVPVLMLTARGEVEDRIRGLGLGADDYVVKPFSPGEIVARVRAILRRTDRREEPAEADIAFPGLVIRPAARLVERDGKALDLATREFDLLAHFARNPRRVFTRDQLLDAVWGYGFAGESSTVTVHVRRLREKLEADPARPRWVKTVWGLGYKFEPDSGDDGAER